MFAGEPLHFSAHVRLVGVVGIYSKPRKIPLHALIGGEVEKTLETEYRLEEFWAISHGDCEPTLDLSVAHTKPLS